MSLLNNEEYRADLLGEGSSREVARKWDINQSTVVRHRQRLKESPEKIDRRRVLTESFEHRPDGSSDYTVPSDRPWGAVDVENFLRSKGEDPENVTYTWGVTANPYGGYWNKLNNVRKKPESGEDLLTLEEVRYLVDEFEPEFYPSVGAGDETFVVALSDWQLGKSVEGQGTESTVRRIKKSLEGAKAQILRLQSEGRSLNTLLLANLGDHIENVAGSYESQTYDIDLNLRDQIELAIELNMLWVKELAPLFSKVIYTANPCNHAQLTRGKGRVNVTDDSDNATGLIAEFVKQLCGMSEALSHVDVRVPRGEMITPVTVSGVNIATAHGHKITGAEETWLAKQSQWLTHERKFIPDLWLVAHKHHLAVTDFGPYTRIQATTVDPGSKWFTDTTGGYSRQGTVVFTVSEGTEGLWDDLRVV